MLQGLVFCNSELSLSSSNLAYPVNLTLPTNRKDRTQRICQKIEQKADISMCWRCASQIPPSFKKLALAKFQFANHHLIPTENQHPVGLAIITRGLRNGLTLRGLCLSCREPQPLPSSFTNRYQEASENTLLEQDRERPQSAIAAANVSRNASRNLTLAQKDAIPSLTQ